MSTSVIENGASNDVEAGQEGGKCIPVKDYKIIAWDLSLTGRRIVDEMCLITASVVPGGKTFSQYVMPYRKPDPNSQRRNGFAVVTMGRYRALRDINTGKILRTKSEISALTDFLAWLGKNRGKDGVLLLSYEQRELIPHVLLEALRRYNLMDEFCAIVKGFVNGHTVAEAKCSKPVNSLSLRNLARILLERDAELITSVEISQAIYEVVETLCVNPDSAEKDKAEGVSTSVADALHEFTISVEKEEENLSYMKGLLSRQVTFRPVFGPMIQMNRRLRQNASVQKQLLAEAGLDYVILLEAFKNSGKPGLAKLMESKLTNVSSKVCEELLNLMVDHFDPPQTLVVTVPDAKLNDDSNEDKVSSGKENEGEIVSLAKQNGERMGNKVPVAKQNGARKGENSPVAKQNGEQKGKKVSVAKQYGERKGDKVPASKQNGEQKRDKVPAAKQNGKCNGEGHKIPVAKQNGETSLGDGDKIPVAKENGEHSSKGDEDVIPVAKQNGKHASNEYGEMIPVVKRNGETKEEEVTESKLNYEHKGEGDKATAAKQSCAQNGEKVPKQNGIPVDGSGDGIPAKQNCDNKTEETDKMAEGAGKLVNLNSTKVLTNGEPVKPESSNVTSGISTAQ